MNILLLSNHLNIGGVTIYLLSLAKGLKKKGHNVYIASSEGELLDKFIEAGAKFIHIPIKTKAEASPKVMISALKLLPIIKKEKIEIIHANSRVTQVLAAWLSRFSAVPFVYTCHGYFRHNFSRKLFPCWGKKIIAISQAVKDNLVKDFAVSAEKIELIHNGVDVDRFGSALSCQPSVIRNELGLGDGPVIGIIGRLSDVKGHIYLIKAMQAVSKQFPQAQLLIVGEGKMEILLKKLVANLGLEKKVIFIPSCDDTAKILQVIDVFAMPSLKEGLGLSLIEAMAAGLAVVGTNIGGIVNLIKDQENGLLVPVQDAQALAQAIILLLKEPKKRKILGGHARSFIAKNFSLEEMVTQTERFYAKCLEN